MEMTPLFLNQLVACKALMVVTATWRPRDIIYGGWKVGGRRVSMQLRYSCVYIYTNRHVIYDFPCPSISITIHHIHQYPSLFINIHQISMKIHENPWKSHLHVSRPLDDQTAAELVRRTWPVWCWRYFTIFPFFAVYRREVDAVCNMTYAPVDWHHINIVWIFWVPKRIVPTLSQGAFIGR